MTDQNAETRRAIDPDEIGLHTLGPAEGSRKERKRVGRGHGSGSGKTAGRGHNGYHSRSGSKDRSRFEGGQMPIHMRLPKLRGPHMKKSMPFEPFRTKTQSINLYDLEKRFEVGADVTPAALYAAGLAKDNGVDIKLLGNGALSKKLNVSVHRASASARQAVESAGGTVELLRATSEA